jgi:hypothetical protein
VVPRVPGRVAAFALVAASVLPGALLVASPAQAASPTTCSAISGKADSPTASLTGCTSATTGGSGTLSASHTKDVDTVTWKNGGSTDFRLKGHGGSGAQCPPDSLEIMLRGTVTKSTCAASSIKGAVSADVCLKGTKKGKVSLLAGTVLTF